jgi:hypothetical protein
LSRRSHHPGDEDLSPGARAGRIERPAGRVNAKEVRTMDEKSSWMRVLISIAIDWRFVIALVLLILALLVK